MARKVQVILVDDINGAIADETVSFALDGNQYEIDLSAANAELLRDALDAYIGKARKAGRRRAGRAVGSGAASRSAAIRAWARENGIEAGRRGRISADVVAQYEAAVSGS